MGVRISLPLRKPSTYQVEPRDGVNLVVPLRTEKRRLCDAWSDRGSAKLPMDKFDEATVDFSQAINLAPEALGNYKDVIKDYNSSIVNEFEYLHVSSHVKILSSFLFLKEPITLSPIDFDLPIKGYIVEELAKAGIKFKSFSTLSQCIWFDKYSHTLYLPRMTVTSPTQTEVFFKNLLALEFNDGARSNEVRHFIQLMDALIDTSRDVRRLRKSHVIRLGSALSDNALAKIWDSMHKPFSTGHLEPPQELKQLLDQVLTSKCCIIKCRIVLSTHFTSIISFVFRLSQEM